jgi:hypothetical protein
MNLCDQCDAIEFNKTGADWICTNGHVQTWTVIPGGPDDKVGDIIAPERLQ